MCHRLMMLYLKCMCVVVFVWCVIEHFDQRRQVVKVLEVWMGRANPALAQKLDDSRLWERVEITAQQQLKHENSKG